MSSRSYKRDVFEGYEAVEAKEHGTDCWRDSTARSTSQSSRRPGIKSPHPHGSSTVGNSDFKRSTPSSGSLQALL